LTPTINDNGYVTLKVKPEISSVVDNVITSSNNVVPVIDTSSAETTIMAKDGSTVILGGLGREEKTVSSEGFPGLSKIPVLGFLFRSGTKRVERTELIIMVTPIIFEGDKFVTVKDADKLQVKPVKKFDVFKPESPIGVVPPAAPPIKGFISKGIPSAERGGEQQLTAMPPALSAKGLKITNKYGPQQSKEAPAEAPMPFNEALAVKGFKPYHAEGLKKNVAPAMSVSSREELASKGFKPYN
jgi:hypothetical protein